MNLNDYVIAVIDRDCDVTRLCSVKAKNVNHAIVKALSNLYNESCEDDFDVLPIDEDLLYEKFIKNNEYAEDLEIHDFVLKFVQTYVEFDDFDVIVVMENGVEIFNAER